MSPQKARAILGVRADATPEQQRRAFRAAVKSAHPDRGGDAASFRIVVAAWAVVKALPSPVPPESGTLQRFGPDQWLHQDLPADAPRGGRVTLETPQGTARIWVGRRALEKGLVRLAGFGEAGGDLLVRLNPARPVESAARGRLKAFAAAWAC